jgi:hypothetical protein
MKLPIVPKLKERNIREMFTDVQQGIHAAQAASWTYHHFFRRNADHAVFFGKRLTRRSDEYLAASTIRWFQRFVMSRFRIGGAFNIRFLLKIR